MSAHTDVPRTRRDRRERQRSFIKEQEHEKARQAVLARFKGGDRSSIASSSSNCSSDSNSHPVENGLKYSSLSSLSDAESHGPARGKVACFKCSVALHVRIVER